MNIDKLISKYLDGDLSSKDDDVLRKLIAEYDSARDDFNTYVETYLAMKDDSKSIEVPKDILSDTEDILMMKILNDFPSEENKKKGGLLQLMPKQFLTMVASLLLITFYNINDLDLSQSENLNTLLTESVLVSTDYPENESNKMNSDNGVISKNTIVNSSNTRNKSKIQSQNSNALISKSNLIKNEMISEFEKKQFSNNIMAFDLSTSKNENNSDFDKIERISETNSFSTNYEANYPSDLSGLNQSYSFYFEEPLNKVLLTNIVWTASNTNDMMLTGFSPESNVRMNNYSTSISYRFNETSGAGVELSYSNINYLAKERRYIRELDPYNRPFQTPISVEVDRDYSMFWASFFYEHDLISYDDFGINMRLGLGTSSEDFTANSRLLLKYELLDGIDFIFGGEMRYFSLSLPQIVGVNSGSHLSFGTVYSIQFKF